MKTLNNISDTIISLALIKLNNINHMKNTNLPEGYDFGTVYYNDYNNGIFSNYLKCASPELSKKMFFIDFNKVISSL